MEPSITAAKKKKSSSSTTVIEVGGEMRMKMAHADAVSMTKCSEVKSRAKIMRERRPQKKSLVKLNDDCDDCD